jgi:superfamily II DNA or RNA helicase
MPVRVLFDRGTLVLSAPDHRLAAATLASPTWDSRTGCFRAPAYRHGALLAELATSGVVYQDDSRSVEPPAAFAAPPLRPYQESALTAWELSGRRGIVVLPTGSGKTRVAMAAMARTGLATLCLVPTRVLLEQWFRELSAVYRGPIGRLGDGLREIGPLTIATFESAYRHMGQLGNRFDLLVVDEVHHFGRGVRDEALEMSLARARLGLTATPLQDERVVARLGELVGPEVYRLAVGDLTGSYLAELDLITLHVDLGAAERAAYAGYMDEFHRVHREFRRLVPDATWEDFARAASRSPQGRAAMTALRRAREILAFPAAKRARLAVLLDHHRDNRVLVFTADNRTAYAVSRAHLLAPITCDIGRAERRGMLERFRRGELRALVSARVLNEGIDIPDADVAIVIGGTHGEREHVQRVGRLLRPAPGKRATVYEMVVTNSVEVRQAQRRRRALAPEAIALP